MKKFLPYILIVIIFAQLFVPFTIGSGVKNNIEIKTTKAEAADLTPEQLAAAKAADDAANTETNDNKVQFTETASATNKTITINVDVKWDPSITMTNKKVTLMNVDSKQNGVWNFPLKDVENSDHQTGSITISEIFGTPIKENTPYIFQITADVTSQSVAQLVGNIGAIAWSIIKKPISGTYNTVTGQNSASMTFSHEGTKTGPTFTITTNPVGVTTSTPAVIENNVQQNTATILPTCDIWSLGKTLGGCIGVGLFRLVFQPSSYLFAITGKLLDATLYYSIQDTSYRSSFVTEGWGVVRDFCNMFFIFVLLYIAFKTILGLGASKTKEMVINVVIIGLLINFSLFATQVIIDTSNILTGVFYKNIQSGNVVNGKFVEETNADGSKGVTSALVNKINPQQIIFSAKEAGNIQPKGVVNSGNVVDGIDVPTFIMVTILASIMNIVGLWVFFMVSLVFIVRVVGLWIAMILAPLAFFSYTMPVLQDLEMVGWKHWWPETLKMAFLAPVFIFFLYIIIQFLSTGLGLVNTSGKHGLDFYIAVIVPFAFLMILLSKAKDITTKMAGTMGEMVSKAAGAIGGATVGLGLAAATGGASMAMRGTLGAFGSKIGNSEKLAAMEAKGGAKGWMAGKLRDVGTSTGKASFDIRNTKLGASAAKSAGITGLGKGKEGGYAKHITEKVEKKQKRAKELEVHENEPLKQKLNQEEMNLQMILNTVATDFERIDKQIETEQNNRKDFTRGSADDLAAVARIADLKSAKKNIKEADGSNAAGISAAALTARARSNTAAAAAAAAPTNAALAKTASDAKEMALNIEAAARAANASVAVGGRSIKQREVEDIPTAKTAIATENRERTTNYAKKGIRWGNGNLIGRGNREAEHKIIMGAKLDSGKKE